MFSQPNWLCANPPLWWSLASGQCDLCSFLSQEHHMSTPQLFEQLLPWMTPSVNTLRPWSSWWVCEKNTIVPDTLIMSMLHVQRSAKVRREQDRFLLGLILPVWPRHGLVWTSLLCEVNSLCCQGSVLTWGCLTSRVRLGEVLQGYTEAPDMCLRLYSCLTEIRSRQFTLTIVCRIIINPPSPNSYFCSSYLL